ncbi:hypothetical protein BZM27_50800 [Paraburkholderia steynii]|uniref:Uncharacterized protein n=1 Tax=Paraburkholderia steynii TaxID=1245441 RepID=A0A4R0X8Y2_9BURK|nr:hypothetical protein BZM27_50800 [Paraburkholderia steynii]
MISAANASCAVFTELSVASGGAAPAALRMLTEYAARPAGVNPIINTLRAFECKGAFPPSGVQSLSCTSGRLTTAERTLSTTARDGQLRVDFYERRVSNASWLDMVELDFNIGAGCVSPFYTGTDACIILAGPAQADGRGSSAAVDVERLLFKI